MPDVEVIYQDGVLQGGVLRLFQAVPKQVPFGLWIRALAAECNKLHSCPEYPPGVSQSAP